MQPAKGENKAELKGWVAAPARPSHRNHGIEYYQMELSVPRLSGAEDTLRIVAGESLLKAWTPAEGQWVRIGGEVRSYNNKSGAGSRLVISVLARSILPETEGEGINRLRLSGVLCKPPVVRRTPLGRDICDLLLAVNRAYGRADYLPCIAWGSLAAECGGMGVGDGLSLDGRLQSRIYRKNVEGREVQRTAYEVSIMNLTEEPLYVCR